MTLQWADIRFPPVNLWSAPTTAAFARARSETIQQGLLRLGYTSVWVTDPRGKRVGLNVYKVGAGESAFMTPRQAVDFIEGAT